MGQPVKDALDSIRNNKLTFTETQYLYRIDSQIEFLGVNWNTVRIGKDKILDAIFSIMTHKICYRIQKNKP